MKFIAYDLGSNYATKSFKLYQLLLNPPHIFSNYIIFAFDFLTYSGGIEMKHSSKKSYDD